MSTGGDIVYRQSRFALVKSAVMYVVLLGCFYALIQGSSGTDWIVFYLLCLSTLASLASTALNGPSAVAVGERGLELRGWRRRMFVAWDDIAEVTVGTWAGRRGRNRSVTMPVLVAKDGTRMRVAPIRTLSDPCPRLTMILDPRVRCSTDPRFDEKLAELRRHVPQVAHEVSE